MATDGDCLMFSGRVSRVLGAIEKGKSPTVFDPWIYNSMPIVMNVITGWMCLLKTKRKNNYFTLQKVYVIMYI